MKKRTGEQIEGISSDAKKNIMKAVKGDIADKVSRTTFRITQEANEALDWLTEHYGTTLKSLIDILCVSIPGDRIMELGGNTFLSSVVKHAKDTDFKKLNRSVRRTMVVSHKSLKVLNGVAKSAQIPRDILVDKGVLLLKGVVEFGKEEEKKKHEKAFEIINEFYESADDLSRRLLEMLGDEDPIVQRFGYVTVLIDNLHSAIRAELNKGEPIDPDTF
jgi:hypothetical protein